MMKTLVKTISAAALLISLSSCATLNPILIPQRGAIREVVLHDLIGERADWAIHHARGDLPPLFVKAGPGVTKALLTEFGDLGLYRARMMKYREPHHVVVHRETGKEGALLTVEGIDFSPFPDCQFLLEDFPGVTSSDVDAVAFGTAYEADHGWVSYWYLLKQTNGTWTIVRKIDGPVG